MKYERKKIHKYESVLALAVPLQEGVVACSTDGDDGDRRDTVFIQSRRSGQIYYLVKI